ncbi:hypothetical protein, partial [Sphingobium amiense]
QAFDAAKHQPEIIRAHQIYVGEGSPRDFIIYRSERDYGQGSNRPNISLPCDHRPPPLKVGHSFDRLILVPWEGQGIVKGRWSFSTFGGSVARGAGLRLLAEKASRVGRLQSLPPKDDRWGN